MVKNYVKLGIGYNKIVYNIVNYSLCPKTLIKKKKFYCPKGLSNLAPAATSDPSGSTSSLGSSVITNWE